MTITWRASCTWRNGTHSRSAVAGFTGLGTEQQHHTTYEFDVVTNPTNVLVELA
jgi:hypothetical protein